MSLRGFLEEMKKKGEVAYVKESISPCFEASSIMRAFDGGSATWFTIAFRPKPLLKAKNLAFHALAFQVMALLDNYARVWVNAA